MIRYDKKILKDLIDGDGITGEVFTHFYYDIMSKNTATEIAMELAKYIVAKETEAAPLIQITKEQRTALLSLFKVKGVRILADGTEVDDNRGGDRKSEKFLNK